MSALKPHNIFGTNIEPGALSQFYDAMKLDCVVSGALMPDAHEGYTLPIGAVVATSGMIFPSWVGYDIGCGVCALRTGFNRSDIEANKKAIFDQIYRDVPVGFNHNKTPMEFKYFNPVSDFVKTDIQGKDAPESQLGTLGGGNHFIEIGVDEEDSVWIITHSGSRNIGHKIASHYMRLASPDGKPREGHYGFDVNSELGQLYLLDLDFGLYFALSNRKSIIDRVKKSISRHADESRGGHQQHFINRNHNHATHKDGVWIHRKGATHAEEGMDGVIPGNMRDGSFIVCGKGNPASLWSSSHGAGRVLGRKEAKRVLSLEEFTETMQGVQALVNGSTLDESPSAYKSIFEVMENQSDLVEVIHHVKPLINIKG